MKRVNGYVYQVFNKHSKLSTLDATPDRYDIFPSIVR